MLTIRVKPALRAQAPLILGRLSLLVAAMLVWGTVPSSAQPVPLGLLAPGNAVVTGFSGVVAPAEIAPGVDPLGWTFIDADGPSLRVVDLRNMRGPLDARLVGAPKPFTIAASQIGQVFAVALDNAVPPNIYAAAASAFGLHIVRDAGGQPAHQRIGAPGTSFMPGLWGQAAPAGGPGSIWKIDGVTGAVTLFANVGHDGAANSGPALGGLAFDPDSDSFFVADRESGLIHRFDLKGAEVGRYDHGLQGRMAQGLPPVAHDPARRLDITSGAFDATRPETWNYAAPERRPFGLAVHGGRLYYAVADGLQIWSAAIAPDGLADPMLEITVPPGNGPTEISKITFDDQGRMILAERPAPNGAEDFHALTQPGAGRVLRYAIAEVYPGLARSWQAVPDDYSIGFPQGLTNGNGGVAIGFDYDRSGRVDFGSCGGFLWSTGEQLRKSGDPSVLARLDPSMPLNVDGLQGNLIWSIRPGNTPPLRSYFIDYDDRFDDDAARGHLGDVAIWRVCGPVLRGGWMLPGWFAGWGEGGGGSLASPPPLTCPADQQKPGFQCCPKGTSPGANGQCKPWCPNGKMDPQGQNLCGLGFDNASFDPGNPNKLTCIGGAAPIAGKGILSCAGHSPLLNGAICQAGWSKQDVPGIGIICRPTPLQTQCPPGQQVSPIDNHCHALCLGGTAWPSLQCCAPGSAVTASGQCCPAGSSVDPKTGACGTKISICPLGSKADPRTGICSPPGGACPPGSTVDPRTGACAKITVTCLPGLSPDPLSGECKRPPPKISCPASQQGSDGSCCKAGWSPNTAAGGCCPPGQAAGPGGACKIVLCPAPGKQVGGKCCSPEDLKPGGACAVALCGSAGAPAGPSNACCDAAHLYAGRNGAQACCPTPLVNGQCSQSGSGKGTPVLPKCVPGSTDPSCCAAGYQWAGKACCLASQLSSSGQCCPAGQKPSGPNNSQCQPDLKGEIPPIGDGGPGSLNAGGQCCAAGRIPTASGVCCAPGQTTSSGLCCPAGQMPDPRNRRACVPTRSCGLRETLVNGTCCPNSNLYKDAAGQNQCCGQIVDPLKNSCSSSIQGVTPECFAGYVKTQDGSCCAENLIGPDGRCSPAVKRLPLPPPIRLPQEEPPPVRIEGGPGIVQPIQPVHPRPRQPPPVWPSRPPRQILAPRQPPPALPSRPVPPRMMRPGPGQFQRMPQLRPQPRPVVPGQRCAFINGIKVCR
ncbi:hypothetical protein SAMN05519103_04387 [Rhizobiales bacterium GAS113]|nr:hypothetical protein SAMN05519103_04387 [Rhizobiales bacterium GAS113]